MHKKGFFDKFKILSRPTGRPQWGQALRAVILMILAALIAKSLGLDKGIGTIIFITLLATLIIDVSLPIRKVFVLTLAGLLMTILAFTVASLSISSLTIFIFFTVIWTFFSFSMYIFGDTMGSLGFTFFITYFLAIIMVNNQSSTLDWIIYCILSFLVASILFIPKILRREKKLREMAAVGFMPQTSLQDVLSIRQILSGVPIDSQILGFFKLGSYFKGFRGYSRLIMHRISDESRPTFKNFLKTLDESSSKIAEHIIGEKGRVNLEKVDHELSQIDHKHGSSKENIRGLIDINHYMRDILHKANEILNVKDTTKEKVKITSPQRSLQEVLSANFNLKNLYIRHALRFTLAMTISLVIVYLTHNRDAIWVSMGILIIIKPDITSTINNMILRLSFNLFAIILAIILAFLFPHQILVWLAFIMLFFFRAFLPNYMGLSVMALTVFIVLIWPTGTVFDNALARMIDISLGAVIAFISAYLVLPSRVTVNLPVQVARTINANNEYVQQVLLSNPHDYNHDKALKYFKKYLLEENNLEAAIKKLQDSFNDISEDLALYQEIAACNNKLAADVTAIAIILETHPKSVPDLSSTHIQVKKTLQNLINSIYEGTKPSKLLLKKIQFDKDVESSITKSLKQYLDWIISDLQLLNEGVEITSQTGALQRYKELK